MAKKTEPQQIDFIGFDPSIRAFCIGPLKKIGEGQVEGTFFAATEVADTAQLEPKEWARAAAEWLAKLCAGDWTRINALASAACSDYCDEQNAREADAAAGYSRISSGREKGMQ
jgi:hypothetical protein